MEKICWQFTFAALMQPFQYDLRSSAAKDNSITHAAAAPSNLDAAIPMRSAVTQLQNAIELRATASETAAPKPDLDAKILKHFLKGILKGKLLAPKLRKSAGKSLSQPWCSHSNTIYGLQLQKATVLRMQLRHHATFMQPFQCDLQLRIQETHRTTHTGTTTGCRTHRRNRLNSKRSKPFIACSHFTRKSTRFRAPASSPQHSPCNIHAAIPMRSATTASRNA